MKNSIGSLLKDIALVSTIMVVSQLFVNAQNKVKKTQSFKEFESKFPVISLPLKTDFYKTTAKSIDNSVTKDFVTSTYNGMNEITPVGKWKQKDYTVLIWQEEKDDNLSWQLSTFRSNGDPIDQIEIMRNDGNNLSVESIVNPNMIIEVKIKKNGQPYMYDAKLSEAGHVLFMDGSSIDTDKLNYLNLKSGSTLSKPINFDIGESSKTVRNTILPGTVDQYTFKGTKGQKVDLKLISNNSFNYFTLSGADTTLVIEGTEWRGTLPATGMYKISVGLNRAERRRRKLKLDYALTVGVK